MVWPWFHFGRDIDGKQFKNIPFESFSPITDDLLKGMEITFPSN
jgi:hypothetical protein